MKSKSFFDLKQIDQILMGISLIGILFCSLVLYFDPLFEFIFDEPQEQDSSTVIGQLVRAENDIRYRSKSSIKWEKIDANNKIHSGGSLFTGSQSSSTVQMAGGSQLKLEQNSLIHFVNRKDIDLPKLAFGKFELKVQGKIKMIINNRLTEISATNSSIEVVVVKNQASDIKLKTGSAHLSQESQEIPLILNESVKIEPLKETERKLAQLEESFIEEEVPPEMDPAPPVSSLRSVTIAEDSHQEKPKEMDPDQQNTSYINSSEAVDSSHSSPSTSLSISASSSDQNQIENNGEIQIKPEPESKSDSESQSQSDSESQVQIKYESINQSKSELEDKSDKDHEADKDHQTHKDDIEKIDFFKSRFFKSKLGLEVSVLTRLSYDQILEKVANPLILSWGFNSVNWWSRHGIGTRVKTQGLNLEDPDRQNLNTFEVEANYRYRSMIYFNPFSELKLSEFVFVVGYLNYRNFGKNFYSPGYELLKTGFTLNLPFSENWFTEAEFYYGKTKTFDESFDFYWNFGFFYADNLSIVAGYRIHLFNARSKTVTPLGVLPYREGSIEGMGALQWRY